MYLTLNPNAKPFIPKILPLQQKELIPKFLLDDDIDKYFKY